MKVESRKAKVESRKVDRQLLLVLSFLFLIVACSPQKHTRVSQVQIADITLYPQDLMYYASEMVADKDALILTPSQQDYYYEDFMARYYSVWSDTLAADTTRVNWTLDYYQKQIDRLFRAPGIGENRLRRDSTFAHEIKQIADLENGFNTLRKGVIKNTTNVRVMPSNKPFFLRFEIPGEGYPFDYWQNSTIPIATPIFIYHETTHWVLIDSHICSGWVTKDQIAYIDDELIDQIIKAPKIVITKDKTPVYKTSEVRPQTSEVRPQTSEVRPQTSEGRPQTSEGRPQTSDTPVLNTQLLTPPYAGFADIGAVFSIKSQCEDYYTVYGYTDTDFLLSTFDFLLSASSFPLPFTTHNIASIGSEMMNQVYGWGGMYFNRDCSQALLDLFICFGILLPRNGKAQAYEFGTFYDMRELKTPVQRKQAIIDKAIPFLTLVRTPGHIMLYVGHIDGEPIVFHSVWGVRTMRRGKEGRHIIGKTVITSLEMGKELPNVNRKMTLINRLEGITSLIKCN